MPQFERKLIEVILKEKNLLFFVVITFLGLMARLYGFNFVGCDMGLFLMPWFNEIKAGGGLDALSGQVGNYTLIYQTIISLMTYINIPCVYQYKLFSVVFDYFMAFAAATLVCEIKKEKRFTFLFNCVYAVALFLPTVVLNSAYWGQCDSILAYFMIMTVMYMYKKRFVRAFVMYGLAFSFKMQCIFILPLILGLYFTKKEFSAANFGITAFVYWLSGIVAYIKGRDLLAAFGVFGLQVNSHKWMYNDFPSFWYLLGNALDFYNMALLISAVVVGLGLYVIVSDKKRIETGEEYLHTAVWFIWALLLFLPSMHERYAYPMDMLLICLSFLSPKYIKFAAVSVTFSVLAYSATIMAAPPKYTMLPSLITSTHALVYTFMWLYFTYTITAKDRADRQICTK
ncbi:MAG: hypothetical protein IJ062_02770 [Firmicutes bacterium]|nr:hypothetical protein [Bacillota bacterium]